MTINLYDIFKHWYYANETDKGSIFFYSDPHFGDIDAYRFRFRKLLDTNTKEAQILKSISKLSDEEYINNCVKELDKMQIKNINKKCTKRDTLVLLGDVGNVECIKRLKAGRKVLICGNHDKGASTYKEIFDEVYEGTLQISPKIMLSHEPVEYKYCLNIHGHSHGARSKINVLEVTDDRDNYTLIQYNVCGEFNDYTPVGINEISKSGLLTKISDIHEDVVTKRNRNANDR